MARALPVCPEQSGTTEPQRFGGEKTADLGMADQQTDNLEEE